MPKSKFSHLSNQNQSFPFSLCLSVSQGHPRAWIARSQRRDRPWRTPLARASSYREPTSTARSAFLIRMQSRCQRGCWPSARNSCGASAQATVGACAARAQGFWPRGVPASSPYPSATSRAAARRWRAMGRAFTSSRMRVRSSHGSSRRSTSRHRRSASRSPPTSIRLPAAPSMCSPSQTAAPSFLGDMARRGSSAGRCLPAAAARTRARAAWTGCRQPASQASRAAVHTRCSSLLQASS